MKGQPAIFIFSVDPVRDLRYYNQAASVNQAGSFTPDGKQIVYASSAGTGRCCRIFAANLDGTGFRPISSSSAIEVEPKVNPKTGIDIVFSSDRPGPQQVYRMSMDGADLERLTPGIGEPPMRRGTPTASVSPLRGPRDTPPAPSTYSP